MADALTVVMPAYDEAGVIGEVVMGWDRQLAALGVPYEIRVYDDGSRDGTGDLLAGLARERPTITAVRQPNRGIGRLRVLRAAALSFMQTVRVALSRPAR